MPGFKNRYSPHQTGSLRRIDGNTGLPWQEDISFTSEEYDQRNGVRGRGQVFTVDRVRRTGGLVNGNINPGGEAVIATNFVPYGLRIENGGNFRGPSIYGEPSDGVAAAEAAAKTNPSSATVSLPNFMYELKDVPELIRNLGKTGLEKIAGTNLNYWYGIKPMVDDLVKLTNFQASVEKTLKEIRKRREGPSWKMVEVFRGSNSAQWSNDLVQSYIAGIQCNVTAMSRVRVWAQVLWAPDSVPQQTSQQALAEAINVALNTNGINAAMIWEAFPWSWAADWCSSIGNFLEANHNSLGISLRHVNIMRHRQENRSYTAQGFHAGFMSPAQTLFEQKSRWPAWPTVEAHMPVLSLRQMSIVGSLACLRGK